MTYALIAMALYLATLFYVLTPGVLLSLPPGAGPKVVAATHAIVFALVYLLTNKLVFKALSK